MPGPVESRHAHTRINGGSSGTVQAGRSRTESIGDRSISSGTTWVWPPLAGGRQEGSALFMARPDPRWGPPAVSESCVRASKGVYVSVCIDIHSYLLSTGAGGAALHCRALPVNESNLRFWNPRGARPRCPHDHGICVALRSAHTPPWDWGLSSCLGWDMCV